MSDKIEKLTPEQEIDLKNFYQECLKIGRSIEPVNHSRAEEIISQFYKLAGFKEPEFLYFGSPHEIITTFKEVKLSDYFAGQHWIYWKALYKFAERIGVVYDKKDSELLDLWFEECKALHWWFPYENYCLISERPIHLSVNEGGFLHDEKRMAIEYPDGWGLYFLNGIKVPEYLVKTPEEELDINFYLKETNADVKAEFVRKYGVERMLDHGKKVDSYENYKLDSSHWWAKSQYELWDMAKLFPGLEYQPYLRMTNQTTGIFHVEAVSPECRTIADAIKERLGGRDMEIVAIK